MNQVFSSTIELFHEVYLGSRLKASRNKLDLFSARARHIGTSSALCHAARSAMRSKKKIDSSPRNGYYSHLHESSPTDALSRPAGIAPDRSGEQIIISEDSVDV